MITMTVMVLIRTKIVTTRIDKIVLTTLSIAVSLYQQTVIISSRFSGLHFGTIWSDSLGFWGLTCHPLLRGAHPCVLAVNSGLVLPRV